MEKTKSLHDYFVTPRDLLPFAKFIKLEKCPQWGDTFYE